MNTVLSIEPDGKLSVAEVIAARLLLPIGLLVAVAVRIGAGVVTGAAGNVATDPPGKGLNDDKTWPPGINGNGSTVVSDEKSGSVWKAGNGGSVGNIPVFTEAELTGVLRFAKSRKCASSPEMQMFIWQSRHIPAKFGTFDNLSR